MLESLQEQVAALRDENMSLRQVVKERLPDKASAILDQCTTEFSSMLAPEPAIEMKHELVEYDFRLIQVCTTIFCEYFLCQLTYVFMNPFSFNFQWKSEPVSTFFATMPCGVRSFSSG